MDQELLDLRQKIIDTVLSYEDELVALDTRISTIVDYGIAQADKECKALDEKYTENDDARDYTNEIGTIQQRIRKETSDKLNEVLLEVRTKHGIS